MAVVRALQAAPPEVACVQGYLDFYNPRDNWLSRCFTIEYAMWFRVVLHGVQRLGIPIPLGGTTVFFRRRVLEAIGAWDAHNVTEDADLGMRLARFGYRCEMVASVTLEEANCHPLRWIRQRARWLKGYAITWTTHMRRPAALMRDLGWRGFLGFQVLFLGAITSYLSLPLFWAITIAAYGAGLDLWGSFPMPLMAAFLTSMVFGQAVMLAVAVLALRDSGQGRMIPWILTLPLYWPLGAVAAYRAIAEIFTSPFYWHKTEHGLARAGITRLCPSTLAIGRLARTCARRYHSVGEPLGVEAQPGLVGAADVVVDRRVGGRAVAGLDRPHDRLVLGDGGRPPPLGADRGVGDQRHRAVHHLELLDEVAVVAGEVDLAVEALVGAGEQLGLGDELAVALDHLPEHPDLLRRRMLGGEARREALELGPHDVELAELVVVERGDDEAAAVAGEHRLGLEPLQRLPDRGARDAEALGELGLDQPVAGAEDALIDRLEHEIVGVLLPGCRARPSALGAEPCRAPPSSTSMSGSSTSTTRSTRTSCASSTRSRRA
jgi:hypothetical protein